MKITLVKIDLVMGSRIFLSLLKEQGYEKWTKKYGEVGRYVLFRSYHTAYG